MLRKKRRWWKKKTIVAGWERKKKSVNWMCLRTHLSHKLSSNICLFCVFILYVRCGRSSFFTEPGDASILFPLAIPIPEREVYLFVYVVFISFPFLFTYVIRYEFHLLSLVLIVPESTFIFLAKPYTGPAYKCPFNVQEYDVQWSVTKRMNIRILFDVALDLLMTQSHKLTC